MDSLLDLIKRLGTTSLPVHVLRRMLALTGDEEMTYIDRRVTLGDNGGSGQAVAFTPNGVIVADYENSPWTDDLPFGADGEDSTVSVSRWSRRELKSIEITSMGKAASVNRDVDWQGEWNDQLPNGVAVQLDYGIQVVRLPLDQRFKADLAQLLPTLCADMNS